MKHFAERHRSDQRYAVWITSKPDHRKLMSAIRQHTWRICHGQDYGHCAMDYRRNIKYSLQDIWLERTSGKRCS